MFHCFFLRFERVYYIFFRTKTNFKKKNKDPSVIGPSQVWTVCEDGMLQPELETTIDSITTDVDEIESQQEEESQILDVASTSGTSTPLHLSSSSIRKEKSLKRKREQENQPIDTLMDTCSTIGQNLNLFLRQSSLDTSEAIKEDQLFGATLAHSLSKIKNAKRKTILKSKMLLLVAEELED